MTRGRTAVYYQSDILTMFDTGGAAIGAQFTTDLPNDQVAQGGLGWSASPPVAIGPTGIKLPKRLRPRHMIGKDSTGRTHRVWVATTGASDWGNSAATWTIIDNDGGVQTVNVTGFVGEAVTL